jgi:hypothetical protein
MKFQHGFEFFLIQKVQNVFDQSIGKGSRLVVKQTHDEVELSIYLH